MATRKQIREAVAALAAAVPDVQRALSWRAAHVDPEDFPLVMVWIEAGDTEPDHGMQFDSAAVLNVEIWAATPGDLDGLLDDLAAQIVGSIEDEVTLDGLVDGLIRSGYTYDRDPGSFAGSFVQTFTITYFDED